MEKWHKLRLGFCRDFLQSIPLSVMREEKKKWGGEQQSKKGLGGVILVQLPLSFTRRFTS